MRSALAEFGVRRGKIAVVMPHVSWRATAPVTDEEREHVRRRYELPRRYIFMSGSVVASESYDEAVEAVAAVVRGGEDAGLVICGRRTQYSVGLLERAESMGIGQRVTIIYECSGRDAEVLRSMAAGQLILPQGERSARTVAEAVLSGVPAAVSDRECFRAAGGDAVLYADPYSTEEITAAVREMLDDGRAERLRRAMRRRAERFSPEQTARRLVEIYESL